MSSSHGTRVVGGGLLCELHAHSRWSDGDLELADVVELYADGGGVPAVAGGGHITRPAMLQALAQPAGVAA
jgi:predicted metal-dependent phosphoesterase TrpH